MAKLDTLYRVASPAYFHNAGANDAAGLLGVIKITTVPDFGPPVISGTRVSPFVVERTGIVPDTVTTATIDMTAPASRRTTPRSSLPAPAPLPSRSSRVHGPARWCSRIPSPAC